MFCVTSSLGRLALLSTFVSSSASLSLDANAKLFLDRIKLLLFISDLTLLEVSLMQLCFAVSCWQPLKIDLRWTIWFSSVSFWSRLATSSFIYVLIAWLIGTGWHLSVKLSWLSEFYFFERKTSKVLYLGKFLAVLLKIESSSFYCIHLFSSATGVGLLRTFCGVEESF